MSKIISDRRMVMRLWLICAAAYFVSYLTRSNFAAVTVEIIAETGWEKSAISAVTTALFISYGIGQVISGWLGDHTRPEMLMAGGLIASAVMNLTIPFCTSISQMTVVWAVMSVAAVSSATAVMDSRHTAVASTSSRQRIFTGNFMHRPPND